MTTIRLLNGPCDPRELQMLVSVDADAVYVRPVPFDCHDVYLVIDKFVEDNQVTVATGEYLHTTGTRRQLDAYRQQLARIGAGRAFKVKREKHERVH